MFSIGDMVMDKAGQQYMVASTGSNDLYDVQGPEGGTLKVRGSEIAKYDEKIGDALVASKEALEKITVLGREMKQTQDKLWKIAQKGDA